MTARTLFRLAALASIISGLVGIPAGFAGDNDLFFRAAWVWVAASVVMILTRRRISSTEDHDKEN